MMVFGYGLWALMIFCAVFWSIAYAQRMQESYFKCIGAMFSGFFASNVMGRLLPEDDGVIGCCDFIPLFWVFGTSICFFVWKTRGVGLCSGIFFMMACIGLLVGLFDGSDIFDTISASMVVCSSICFLGRRDLKTEGCLTIFFLMAWMLWLFGGLSYLCYWL